MQNAALTIAQRRAQFAKLHEAGCFVIPNPWDIGTARWLQHKGFAALATTSAGFAFTRGRDDQDIGLGAMLAHIAELVDAVPELPFNADFENGYADKPEDVARNVRACAQTGVAGLSIEDATGRPGDLLYPQSLAVERIIAAREALSGSGVLLTARAEGVLVGDPGGLEAACRRIEAFAAAGADVLYAPGIRRLEDMRMMISAAGGKPVNILIYGDFGIPVDEIAALGARRISVGSALARAAWASFMQAVDGILAGNFSGFAGNAASRPLGPFFQADRAARGEPQGRDGHP